MFWLIWPIAILYFIQNHLSAALVMGIFTSVMMLMAGTRLIYFIEAGSMVIALGAIALMKKPTRFR